MTIIFASISSSFIAVTADSSVTKYFENHSEYEKGKKISSYDGLGSVATWGERSGNAIFQYLSEKVSQGGIPTISDLADEVNNYLRDVYRPHQTGLSRVGYYVLGFDSNKSPMFFQILWAEQSRHPASIHYNRYHFYDSSPEPGTIRFSYDGRFGLAHSLLGLYIEELNSGSDVNFNLGDPLDRIRLHDFVIRFSSEITPEVGPPFITHVISPSSKVTTIVNRELNPISWDTVREKLNEINLLS